MKIKSILIAANNYPTKTDPVYTFLDQLVVAIAKMGISVTVIAPSRIVQHYLRHTELHPYKRMIDIEGGESITVIQPRYITLGSRFESFNMWMANRVVNRTARRIGIKPDVCYGYFWHWGLSLFEYSKRNNIPLMVHTGETPIILHQHYKVDKLESFSSYISGVVCNSSFCKQLSIEASLIAENKCEVFPNAINPSVFYPRDKQMLRKTHGVLESDFVIAFTGWFDDNKGSKRVSDAIKSLGDSSIKSVFIGDSPSGVTQYKPDCDGIIHIGRVPHSDIPLWLSIADVFVLPTQHEGCSNGIVEAMACGLPVISSNRSFNWDILTEYNSILIDPMSITEIAGAIKALKNDRQKREAMSNKALETASALTIDKRAKNIISFIESKI